VCNDHFLVNVSDSGSGVSAEIEAKLFQPFVTTKAEGMGIGLSVCRTIVEAHGGVLWMEQNSNGGSTFRFTLPMG
jgi:two-component system sensor kinase FixL